jgi:hypothetical protein
MSFNATFVMDLILSSPDSAPLSSVMSCWNAVATTVDMSFRDELFGLGAWTDWLGTCWLCLKRRGCRFLHLRAAEAVAVAVLLHVAGEEHPSRCQSQSHSLSYVTTDSQSVSQSILVSSRIWGPRPEFVTVRHLRVSCSLANLSWL